MSRLPRIIAELISSRDTYRVLDAVRAKHTADQVLAQEHDRNWRPGDPPNERMVQQSNLQNAFSVEMMVNPALEGDVRESLARLTRDDPEANRAA